jgi:hypothetical protein
MQNKNQLPNTITEMSITNYNTPHIITPASPIFFLCSFNYFAQCLSPLSLGSQASNSCITLAVKQHFAIISIPSQKSAQVPLRHQQRKLLPSVTQQLHIYCNTPRYNGKQAHLSQFKVTFTYKLNFQWARRCAQLRHVTAATPGAVQSCHVQYKNFYHLAGCRTPPYSLARFATSLHVLQI